MAGSSHPISRRRFLQVGAAAWAMSGLGLNPIRAAAPSERVTVGMIGLGSRGFNLLDSFLTMPDAQVVAVCDVDALHYRDRAWGQGTAFGREPAKRKIEKHSGSANGVFVTGDFREVCLRTDIDALVIATPDHWHALCTLEALRNGKAVYCEKPVTHTFHEGQVICREVAKRKAVFQTGSQQRSDALFRRAVELVRNGILGKIHSFEVGLPPGYDRPQGDSAVTEPPEHLDYDFWCGPSPKLPYMRARHHRWWRGHRAYGGGVLMDWIGHHNDIAHWALELDKSGPVRVEAVNWTFPEGEIYNTPHHYEIRCEYAGGIQSSISSRHALGTKLIGEDGWVFVTRGSLKASDPRWTRSDFQPGEKRVDLSDDHVRNFLDCVKSRKACIAPAETGHRSITPGHLGYVSQALGRALKWDPKQEAVLDDDRANQLLKEHHYQKPWSLAEAK